MNQTQQPAPGAVPGRRKTTRKWACCLFGCLGIVIAIVLTIGGSLFYVTRPVKVDTQTTVFVPDADIYVRGYMRPEDKLLARYLFQQTRNIEKATHNPGADVMESFGLNDWREQSYYRDLEKNLPLEVEFVGNEEEGTFGFSVGLAASGRMLGLIYRFIHWSAANEGKTRDHGDGSYIVLEEQNEAFYLTYKDRIFYAGNNEPFMVRVLDGLGMEEQVLSDVDPLAEVDMSAPLFGYLRGKGLHHLLKDFNVIRFESSKVVVVDDNYESENVDTPGQAETRARLEAVDEGLSLEGALITQVSFHMRITNETELETTAFIDASDKNETLTEYLRSIYENAATETESGYSGSFEETARGYKIVWLDSDLSARIPAEELE